VTVDNLDAAVKRFDDLGVKFKKRPEDGKMRVSRCFCTGRRIADDNERSVKGQERTVGRRRQRSDVICRPNNAVPVSTWFNDPHDTELTDLCPFLTDLAAVDDVRGVLDGTL